MMQVITPAPRDTWRSVLAEDSRALPEHAPEWVDALCRVGPYADASRLYSFADGRRFVLPLVRRTGVAGLGRWLMSYPPSWGMGGLVGGGADGDVIRAVLTDLKSTRSQRVSIRPDPRRFALWSTEVDDSDTLLRRRAHVIELRKRSGSAKTSWSRLSVSRSTPLPTHTVITIMTFGRWSWTLATRRPAPSKMS